MRLHIEITSVNNNGTLLIPLHYNKLIQGLIYSMIRQNLPDLHDDGYSIGGRKIKLFVFSRLLGKVKEIKNGHIAFTGPVTLKIASPDNYFIETLAGNLLHASRIDLAGIEIILKTLSVQKQADFSHGCAKFKAISPVTVYSTLLTPDGRKKTYYYHPSEKEFTVQLLSNLRKKAEALGLSEEQRQNISVKCIKVKNNDQKIVYFKDTLIKGWLGMYELEGDSEMLNTAWECGIGAKNSQGFGMLEIL